MLCNIQCSDLIAELVHVLQDHKRLEEIAVVSSFHPNGFIKIQLCIREHAKIRLHFWRSKSHLAEENVHNHRWRMASKVMTGSLHSEIYEELPPHDNRCNEHSQCLTLRMYQKDWEPMRPMKP